MYLASYSSLPKFAYALELELYNVIFIRKIVSVVLQPLDMNLEQILNHKFLIQSGIIPYDQPFHEDAQGLETLERWVGSQFYECYLVLLPIPFVGSQSSLGICPEDLCGTM